MQNKESMNWGEYGTKEIEESIREGGIMMEGDGVGLI